MAKPHDPDGTLAFGRDLRDVWIDCPDCRNHMFWLEFSHTSCVRVWCRTCRKTWRVLLGVDTSLIDK